MIIAGFQSLSLLDYPGIICAIVFTQGCPFRCVYCHNPELIPLTPKESSGRFDEDMIIDKLKRHRKIIEGVCITGGEPTVHYDLPSFIAKIKHLGLLVKLDTNGVNPRVVERLIKQCLVDFIAMDLKHTWSRYSDVIGLQQQRMTDNCCETMRIIQNSTIKHEFRTTIYPGLHTEQDILEIAKQLQPNECYALQNIRYDKMLNQKLTSYPQMDLKQLASKIQQTQPELRLEVRA